MIEVLAVALGGALGAVARFGLTNLATDWLGSEFPYGTLIVNVAGSFLIGVMFVLLIERDFGSGVFRSATIVGLLGAFTTFSTFSLQTLGMLQEGRTLTALTYIGSSVVICLLATAAGMLVTRQVH